MTGPDLSEAAREMAARTRAEQGLPPTVEHPVTLDRLAALLDVDRAARVAS